MSDEQTGAHPAGQGTLWLYKQHDLLIGPLSYEAMLDEVECGNVTGETMVCIQGNNPEFHAAATDPLLMVALAKASARNTVEAQQRSEAQTRRKLAGLRGGIIVAATLAGIVVIGAGAKYLAEERPWEKKVVLPDPIITDELPVIALASRRNAADDDSMAYPSFAGGKGSAAKGTKDTASSQAKEDSRLAEKERDRDAGKGGDKGGKGASRKQQQVAQASAKKKVRQQAEKDGLSSVQEWDEDAIQQIVATKKKSLHPCLAAEAHRQSESNPTWSARIPLEFTVSNSGKVVKLWIDHYDYKSQDTELYRCMFKTLSTWKFPAYSGEQANISIAFNVQAR